MLLKVRLLVISNFSPIMPAFMYCMYKINKMYFSVLLTYLPKERNILPLCLIYGILISTWLIH